MSASSGAKTKCRQALEGIESALGTRRPVGVDGNREFNPGWHTALDLQNLLTVSEAVTRAALERKESRGAQFREDYPEKSAEFAQVNMIVWKDEDGAMQIRRDAIPEMPEDLTTCDRGNGMKADAIRKDEIARNPMKTAVFRIWRGDANGGEFRDYTTEVSEGMVVLDAVHDIQATQANDLACRWNCKAGKCGSCSAEVNGMPKLMCMTRLSDLPLDRPVTIEPMKAFPRVKDLITDVSWNFEVKKRIKKFKPRPPDAADGTWRMAQQDIDRVQEFRKCIECFLCQDVCHVLRDHHKHDQFIGPRFLVYAAALEMHPLDTEDRVEELREAQGIGYCNITKCCTKVCPEDIQITDNAIIPLKERVVDDYYDPLGWIWKRLKGKVNHAKSHA